MPNPVTSEIKLESVRNPHISLDRAVSGEYRAHLEGFVAGLNEAIRLGSSVSPYISPDVAQTYASLSRRCENAFEVSVLTRALPAEAQRVAGRVTLEALGSRVDMLSVSSDLPGGFRRLL